MPSSNSHNSSQSCRESRWKFSVPWWEKLWTRLKAGTWTRFRHGRSRGKIAISRRSVRRLRNRLGEPQENKAIRIPSLTAEERRLSDRIRLETQAANRNNVTRTEAYRSVFFKAPELHWAFLAHMVSRNSGWSMTDLRGELLPRLLGERLIENLFSFLESANALIFQDAYPQLLLYLESRRRGRPLFHLLPEFYVSAFMRSVWEQFWQRSDPALLTVSLIVNEQSYIEGRIVRDPYYREHVFRTLPFRGQALLQLNQVVFPYDTGSQPNPTAVNEEGALRLAGLILEDFTDLEERIEFGKKLYATLFGIPDVHDGALRFARRQAHTGSRADYWPSLFTRERTEPATAGYTSRMEGNRLRRGAPRLYSPPLAEAWKDRSLPPVNRYDWWCRATDGLKYLKTVRPPEAFEMTGEHGFGLRKLEWAVLAGQPLPD